MDQAGLRTHELPPKRRARRLPMLNEHSGIVRGLDSFTVAEAAPGLIAIRGRTGFPVSPCEPMSPGHLKHAAKVRGLTGERQSRDRTWRTDAAQIRSRLAIIKSQSVGAGLLAKASGQ
jgi:hypothetical protein